MGETSINSDNGEWKRTDLSVFAYGTHFAVAETCKDEAQMKRSFQSFSESLRQAIAHSSSNIAATATSRVI